MSDDYKETCRTRGRPVAGYVPRGGDGSALKAYQHKGPDGERCPGSNQPTRESDPRDWPEQEDAAGYAAAEATLPNSDSLAELVRRGAGPPPGWFDDEEWGDSPVPSL